METKKVYRKLPANPLVSVLMPAFNEEKFIEVAVNSIQNQTYQNWELLILNDGCTDETEKIIKSFKDQRIRVFENDLNKGYLESCNRLFAECVGDLVTFQDADDLSTPYRLATYVDTFSSGDGLGFVTTNHTRIDASGRQISVNRVEIDYERYAINQSYSPYLACATIALRKELLDEIGGYHPFFIGIGGEDYHLLFVLSRRSQGLHLRSESYLYRQHSNQTQNYFNNPLAYYFLDILQEIRYLVIQEGSDPLSSPDSYRKHWVEYTAKSTVETEWRKVFHRLNRGYLAKAGFGAIRIIIQNPLKLNSWKNLARIVYTILHNAVRWLNYIFANTANN